MVYKLLRKIGLNLISFETFFILFLFAGRFKADSRFQWFPVDLTGFFFVFSVFLGVIILIRNNNFKQKALLLVTFGITFLLYSFFSLLWTPGIHYATQKAFYNITLVLWPLVAFVFIIANNKQRMTRFIIILWLFSFWIAIESLLFYLRIGGKGFITPLGGNYLGIGRVLGLGAIISIWYFSYVAKNCLKNIVLLIICLLYLFLLFVVGGRGPLLATLISLFIPLLTNINLVKKQKKYIIKPLAPLGILLIITVFIVGLSISGIVRFVTLSRLEILLRPDMGASALTRIQAFQYAYEFWQEKPFLGHGIGSYPILRMTGDVRLYPHNIILEILSEIGLVGLLLFLGFISFGLFCLGPWKTIYKDPWRILILMLFTNVLINAMISGDIPDNRILFGIVGLMVYRGIVNEEQT